MADMHVQKKNIFDMYQFETYINGFLHLEYPKFDTKHGFLSSVEAEILSFSKEGSHLHFRHFTSILRLLKVALHPNLINRTLRLGSRSVFPLSAM